MSASNIYTAVRDELIEYGRSIPQIAKTFGISLTSVETMTKMILDFDRALDNDLSYKVRRMVLDDYLTIPNIAKVLGLEERKIRYALLHMEDTDLTKQVAYAWGGEDDDDSEDSDYETESEDSDTETSLSSDTESTLTIESEEDRPSFKIPIEGPLHTKFLVYLNHGDRDEYDLIRVERKPKQEGGTYYITYTADVRNGTQAKNKRSRTLLEADGLQAVMDYFKDTFDLLALDKQHFKSVDLMPAMYPTITMTVEDLLEKKTFVLRIIEDCMVSETYTL